jgi:hypothetical protein
MRKLPSQTLFDQQRTGLHASYTKLRDGDEPYFSEQRDYLDGLWHRTRLHLDTDFKSRFALETDQRFWELRLAGTLLDLGYELDKAKKGRPDFGTHLPTGQRLWIEATAPTRGDTQNADRPAGLMPKGGARLVPHEQLLMRYTQCIHCKYLKFLRYQRKGIVTDEDRCVIAVSSAGLWPHTKRIGFPRILSAVLGIDEQFIGNLQKPDDSWVEIRHLGIIRRAGGAPIETTPFLCRKYELISGLIHDSARPTGWGQQGSDLFMSMNNPLARAELPRGFFGLGREYWATPDGEMYSLECTEFSQKGQAMPA